jgi:hypothetical protein
MRHYVKSVIKTKKREYISNLTSLVKDKPKEFWKFFCSKTTRSSLPDTLVYNDKQFTSSEGKADAFNKEADMIYLDFSKASDSVSHPKLLLKLQQHGISGLLLNWFSDYLNLRCDLFNLLPMHGLTFALPRL